MLEKGVKYCYNDISIKPTVISNISSRKECIPYIDYFGENKLPIFTAPMSSVVGDGNYKKYNKNNIISIIPRNIKLDKRIKLFQQGEWVAFGLDEFERLFIDNFVYLEHYKEYFILIDIANGHMSRLVDLVKKKNEIYQNKSLHLMVGNVANPETYDILSEAGVDYVRMNIGTGEGCITWSNTGIGYPVASLIDETYKVKLRRDSLNKNSAFIVADGGIRNYSDVIKALALGADFVMIGGLFSKLLDSSAQTYYKNEENGKESKVYLKETDKITINVDGGYTINNDFTVNTLYKEFYGMASSHGQKDLYGTKVKTSEGVKKDFEITTTIEKWSSNMSDYLKSAMSYCGIKEVHDFNPENVTTILISQSCQNSINR